MQEVVTTESEREVLCVHCGLVVPQGRVRSSHGEEQFCCAACETVYRVIHSHGLGEYYVLREKLSSENSVGQPPEYSERDQAYLDSEAFQRLYILNTGEQSSVELYVEGLHCAACVWLLERIPAVQPEIADVRVEFGRSLAKVRWNPEKIKLSKIAELFERLGYRIHPFRSAERKRVREQEARKLLGRIGIAFISAANTMLLAICLYAGFFLTIDDRLRALFQWSSLILSLPAVLWSGNVFYRGALASLRTKQLHLDLPITIGILSGFLFSVVNTLRGAGEVYFDTLSVLIFLLLVGRWLQFRGRRMAQEASETLCAFLPTTARIVREGRVDEVALETLIPGDLIEVRAHDVLPVDGTVASGESWIDCSVLTGESNPVKVVEGERVYAGTRNTTSPFRITAAATGEETRVGRIMRAVDQRMEQRAPIVILADRISGGFTAVVMVASLLAFIVGAWHSVAEGFERAIALLVVCCPCALGMATPLALTVAVGRAARRGIFIKGGDVVESLANVREVILDKTGTLTEGKFKLLRWIGSDDQELLNGVIAIEENSVHPIAKALREQLKSGSLLVGAFGVVDKLMEISGAGIRGEINGLAIAIGSRRYLEGEGVTFGEGWIESLSEIESIPATPVCIAQNGELVAVCGLGDPMREDSIASVRALIQRQYSVHLLSGDSKTIVESVGNRLGIPAMHVLAERSPEQKLAYVESFNNTMMVGDGVNDAAALVAADVGVAAHGGAEGSLIASDVFLTKPGMGLIVEILDGAKDTIRVIRRNLAFSLLYNLIGGALAITGYLGPLGAAILMPLSSITVVSSSFASRVFSKGK